MYTLNATIIGKLRGPLATVNNDATDISDAPTLLNRTKGSIIRTASPSTNPFEVFIGLSDASQRVPYPGDPMQIGHFGRSPLMGGPSLPAHNHLVRERDRVIYRVRSCISALEVSHLTCCFSSGRANRLFNWYTCYVNGFTAPPFMSASHKNDFFISFLGGDLFPWFRQYLLTRFLRYVNANGCICLSFFFMKEMWRSFCETFREV